MEEVRELPNRVVLLCKDQAYVANKVTLLDKSPKFRVLIHSNWNLTDINIPVDNPAGVEAIATYINDSVLPAYENVDEVLATIAAANWLEMDEFKRASCEAQVPGVFDKESIMRLTDFAVNSGDAIFRNLYFRLLDNKFQEVWRTIAEEGSMEQVGYIMDNFKYGESTRMMAFLITWVSQDVKRRFVYWSSFIQRTNMRKMCYDTLKRFIDQNPMFWRHPVTRHTFIEKVYFDQTRVMFNNENIIQEYKRVTEKQLDRCLYSQFNQMYTIYKVFPYSNNNYVIAAQKQSSRSGDLLLMRYRQGLDEQKICFIKFDYDKSHIGIVGFMIYTVVALPEKSDGNEGLKFRVWIMAFNTDTRTKGFQSETVIDFKPNAFLFARNRIYLLRRKRSNREYIHIARFFIGTGTVRKLPADEFSKYGGEQIISLYHSRLIAFVFRKLDDGRTIMTCFRESGDEWEKFHVSVPWKVLNRVAHYHDQQFLDGVTLHLYPYVNFLGDFWRLYQFNPETLEFRESFVSFNLPLGLAPGGVFTFSRQDNDNLNI